MDFGLCAGGQVWSMGRDVFHQGAVSWSRLSLENVQKSSRHPTQELACPARVLRAAMIMTVFSPSVVFLSWLQTCMRMFPPLEEGQRQRLPQPYILRLGDPGALGSSMTALHRALSLQSAFLRQVPWAGPHGAPSAYRMTAIEPFNVGQGYEYVWVVCVCLLFGVIILHIPLETLFYLF